MSKASPSVRKPLKRRSALPRPAQPNWRWPLRPPKKLQFSESGRPPTGCSFYFPSSFPSSFTKLLAASRISLESSSSLTIRARPTAPVIRQDAMMALRRASAASGRGMRAVIDSDVLPHSSVPMARTASPLRAISAVNAA